LSEEHASRMLSCHLRSDKKSRAASAHLRYHPRAKGGSK
jgi:hypothetical protein